MDPFCVICEVKCKIERLSDLTDLAPVFYNLTSFQISERKDKHLLKICNLCKEKLLQYDVFRELCIQACTKVAQHVSVSPVTLENNSGGAIRSDDESLLESNPSGISNTNDVGFSNDQASDDEGNMKMPEHKNDHLAQNYSPPDIEMKNSHECLVCGKRFLNPIRLEGHIKTHRPARCKICSREFSTYHNLKIHTLYKHTDVPRTTFSCDFQDCKSSFATKQGLAVHRRRHDPKYAVAEPTPAVCEACGKKFSSKGALKKHSYIHTANHPFQCAVCNKGYTTAYKLKQHTSRQNCLLDGQNEGYGSYYTLLFPCDYCDRLFSYIGNAKRHMRMVH